MSRLGEFILRKLSRDPKAEDYININYENKHKNLDLYVSQLNSTFPNLSELITGKRVIDIGCANGMESLALLEIGAFEVIGIDIRIDPEKSNLLKQEYPDKRYELEIMDAVSMTFESESFDSAVTCGSFEHFLYPETVLKECKRVIKTGGRIFLTSGVWSHPWGAHMMFFTKVPWVQFFFSEKTIMNVRKLYRNDGASKFQEVEGGLNKVGIRKFNMIVERLDLKIDYIKLVPVKNISFLTRIPYINEFFSNQIIAVLQK